MSIEDFLTKQLFIEKVVVTFRWLSREFGINVNTAKNELEKFHLASKNDKNLAHATYFISGSRPRPTRSYQARTLQTPNDMEVDGEETKPPPEEEEIEEEDTVVPQNEQVLVSELDLEAVKAQFTRISVIHIYGLSPAPIRHASILCVPTTHVRVKDAGESLEFMKTVGKIIGKLTTSKPPALVSSTSKPTPAPVVQSKIATPPVGEKSISSTATSAMSANPKLKPTGKLDFFGKAKSKEQKAEELQQSKDLQKAKDDALAAVKAEKAEKAAVIDNQKKTKAADAEKQRQAKVALNKKTENADSRGKKRKNGNALVSDDSEKEEQERKVAKALVARKGVVLSDSEDEDDGQLRKSNKKAVFKGKERLMDVVSDTEQDLNAMMDIADEHVIKISRVPSSASEVPPTEMEEGTPELEDQPMEDAEDEEPVPRRRKPKPKKVIPVGKNGLKKKRVVKSRMTVLENGYMATEDYSEYESVEEEEEEEASTKVMSNSKMAAIKQAKSTGAISSGSSTKLKPAKSTSKNNVAKKIKTNGDGKNGLQGFFGKKNA